MLKLLTDNWDLLALGVLGAVGTVLGIIHDDKRKDRKEERQEKAKYIYETHVKKEA